MLRANLIAIAGALVVASSAAIAAPASPVYAASSPRPLAPSSCNGTVTSQYDTSTTKPGGYYLHGWLGLCTLTAWEYTYYAGSDSRWSWGGAWHNVSFMSVELRAWNCGQKVYDQVAYASNTAYQALQTGWINNGFGCGPQADATGYMQVDGQWSWDWYLHIN